MPRNVTEIQARLIALGYLAPVDANGNTNADGKFGEHSLDAYNHYRASIGKGPVVQASMAELNADLFPEEQPAPPPKHSNPVTDYLTQLAIKAALSKLKGLPAMAFLTGYKTYVIAALIGIVAALEVIGVDVPFVDATPTELFTYALGLIFARNGAKSEVKKALGN